MTDDVMYCKNAPINCRGGTGNQTCLIGHSAPMCQGCDIENGYTRAGNY